MAETMVKKIRQAVKSVAGKKAAVSVDYPREGEIIAFPQYSLRFNARPPPEVEASINQETGCPAAKRRAIGGWIGGL